MSTHLALYQDLSYAYVAFKSLKVIQKKLVSPVVTDSCWELDSCGRPYLIADSDPIEHEYRGVYGASPQEANRYLTRDCSTFIMVPSSLYARDSLVLHQTGWRSLSATAVGIVKEFDMAGASKFLNLPVLPISEALTLIKELAESGYPQMEFLAKENAELQMWDEIFSRGGFSSAVLYKGGYKLETFVPLRLVAQMWVFRSLRYDHEEAADQYFNLLLDNNYPAFVIREWLNDLQPVTIERMVQMAAYCVPDYEYFYWWLERIACYFFAYKNEHLITKFLDKEEYKRLKVLGEKEFSPVAIRRYKWLMSSEDNTYNPWPE